MNAAGAVTVAIERMGRRGEGVATFEDSRFYVPFALPGETVSVARSGERGHLLGLLQASRDRIEPFCPYFTICGGCAIQTWADPPYRAWKRDLLVDALAHAGVSAPVAPLVDAHGRGRRRATFHARTSDDGRVVVGFMQARAHAIVPIEHCPVLDPALDGALPAARAIAASLALGGKPLDLLCTATEDGLDIDLRGHGPLDDATRGALAALALRLDLARLSNHGTIVLERRKPAHAIGRARVELPPGAFLQATAAGEAALAAEVQAALAGRKRVADLFCGIGTFALRLAETAAVVAVDSEPSALSALDRAARAAPALRAVAVDARDLHRRPLTPGELARFDGVCLDPPRAGAEAQARALAASTVSAVAYVSCDPASFARDATILVGGGFEATEILPVDQFRHSAHLEIVARFHRKPPKRQRRLLG